jgi:hypothetical protein
MGALSAMSSINRVLEKHGEEIRREYLSSSPLVADVELDNAVWGIKVLYVLRDGTVLEGPLLDIDELAEAYPDCEVGY